MEHLTPIDGDRLHVLETIRFLAGEGTEVARALAELRPNVVAMDRTPDETRRLLAHVRHGTGVEVGRLDEVWTNCLAAYADVEPLGEYAAAAAFARRADVPLVALDRAGGRKEVMGVRKKRALEEDLVEDPIVTDDLYELAMAFRARLHSAGVLDEVEEREEEMAGALHEALARGRVVAVLPYPTSEEVSLRVRNLIELTTFTDEADAQAEGADAQAEAGDGGEGGGAPSQTQVQDR